MDRPQWESGKTVRILCIGCDFVLTRDERGRNRLESRAFIEGLLRRICSIIGMTPISGPHTAKLIDINDNLDLNGASSVLIIAESHIAIHAWSKDRVLRIVIDSCADFDEDKVGNELDALLSPKSIRIEPI